MLSSRVARIDVFKGSWRSVSGAGIGSTEEEVKKMYGDLLSVERHKYDDKGHYLIVRPHDPTYKGYEMRFETDGKVVTTISRGLSRSGVACRGLLVALGRKSSLLFVDLLQAPDPDRIALARRYGFGRGFGGAHGGDAGHAVGNSGAPDRFLVAERMRAGGGVDDQLQRPALQQIDRVGPAFIHFEDRLALDAGALNRCGGAARRGQLEAELGEPLRHSTASALWRSLTLMKTVPLSGSGVPALSCAFANASPKFSPTPITSPVERISGPSAGSTPGNLLNGNTGDFTKNLRHVQNAVVRLADHVAKSASFLPSIRPTAIFGSGTPVALLTYGTVREARGFTSST